MKHLIALLVALLLAACAPPVAQLPTPTPAPTATPTPAPTATPTPAPTATPAPADEVIGAALTQTAAAASYRLSLTLTGSGAVLANPPADGQVDVLMVDGTFAGDDYEYTLTGMAAALVAADPGQGLRALRAEGTTYLRGPIPLLGLTDDAWYRLRPEQAALVAPQVSAASAIGALAGFDFAGYTPAGATLEGGQTCQTYRGEREATLGLLQSLAQTGLIPEADPALIEDADSEIVICADGYLHTLALSIAGSRPAEPPAPFSYDLRLVLSEFARPITITPPAGAREVPAPTR